MTPTTGAQNISNDPRARAHFCASFYPKANAKEPPPPNTADRNERIMLEFLAAYYDLNCEHSKLIEARKMVECPERATREHECLQAIETILIRRDALEDQYAPFGIIAEPVMEEGFTVDVKFTFGSVNAAGRLRAAPMTSTTTIPIRLPPGVKLENLTLPDKNLPPDS